MPDAFDLTSLSDADLDRLIAATAREHASRHPPAEDKTTDDGIRGQDVHDPKHGVITTPTPHHVRAHGETGLPLGARVEGSTVKP